MTRFKRNITTHTHFNHVNNEFTLVIIAKKPRHYIVLEHIFQNSDKGINQKYINSFYFCDTVHVHNIS